MPDVPEYDRPKTRGECRDGFRPCPYVGCVHHLFIEVKSNGSLRFPWGDDVDALEEMPNTCSLDVADAGPITLEETGHMMLITRERVRQIEGSALARLKDSSDAKFAEDEYEAWNPLDT